MAPNAKPVESVPNTGLAGVPKVGADVAAVGAGAANVNGAGAVAVPAVVDDAAPLPKVKGFGGADEELKAGWAAGASNAGFPKVNVGCVGWVVAVAAVVATVAVGAAVETVLARPNPPNEAVVVLWLDEG